MNAAQSLIEAIGWTLIHVVWQGLLAAAAVALLWAGLPKAKPNLRYAIACTGLLAIALGGLFTFAVEMGQHAEKTRDGLSRVDGANRASVDRENGADRTNSPALVTSAAPDSERGASTPPANAAQTSAPGREPSTAEAIGWRSAIGQGTGRFLAALRPLLPAIVVLWGIGVIVLTARLVLQWRSIQRVSSGRQPIEDPALVSTLRSIEDRLGIRTTVGLFSCATASVPFVLGWLKPAILLPAGLVTGLSATELDAIIAHELAHIRRHDYLVNLLQTLVETIYFYHPAVWWISRLARQERECCCDEMAAMACGDRALYGRALLALEQWRDAPARLRVAANGGSLVERVRRLAGAHAPRQYRPGAIVLVIIALFGTAAALVAVDGRAESQVEAHKITVATVESKPVTLTQSYVAQIHAHRHIKVRALERGYLEAPRVKEGQQVKQGDILFTVVPILYQKKVEAENAEARHAQLELNSAKKLAADKVASQDQVSLFEAKMAKAQANADLARAELDFATVRAPFAGIVGRMQHQQGSLVMEGEVLTTLSDNSVIWVYFNVPEASYLEYVQNQQKEDSTIELRLANGQKFDQIGKLGAIDADFNNQTGNIPFRADFPNPDHLLRHGQTGTVLISRPLNDAIVIPQRATFEVLQKRYVYVVDKDDVAHLREIGIQNELEDGFVVKSGLNVNDKIVVDGVRQVHDGEKVQYDRQPK
jgi:membrane fusion protein, multidrug efflux system